MQAAVTPLHQVPVWSHAVDLEQEPGAGVVWGILWGAGASLLNTVPLESFVCETDHRKGLCDALKRLENCPFFLGS